MSKQMQDEFNQNFKDIIEGAINKAKELQEKIEEPFFTSQYPFLEEDFIDAFNELINTDPEAEGLSITKENLEIVDGDTFIIDGDGFPYVNSSITIKDIDLEVNFIIYHHTDWDFYFKN